MPDIDAYRYRVARNAELDFATIVAQIERDHGVEMPHLRHVCYTIDRPRPSATKAQAPYHRIFPSLRAKPYWDLGDLEAQTRDIVLRLESEFAPLKREFLGHLSPSRFVDGDTGYFGTSRDWRHWVVLRHDMTFAEDVRNSFPHLCGVLEPLARMKLARKSYFALMRPGVRLPNHCGGTNLFLRLHLGVVIPHGDAALRVGGETRHWKEGSILLFDDSFGHEAWNETPQDRYILLIRILHPDLVASERIWLPEIARRFSMTESSQAVNRVLRAFRPHDRQEETQLPPLAL